MSMRDRYFRSFQSIVFKRGFYKAHYMAAYKANLIYSIVLAVLSFACITIWSISKTQPIFWALIIGLAQLAQAFASFLPWSEQLCGLKYLMPELETLIIDMATEWANIDIQAYDDLKIQEKITEFDSRFCRLENQYVGTIFFSESKKYTNEAERTMTDYLKLRYCQIQKEEVAINA